MITFCQIEEARERIKDQIYFSPFPYSEAISRMTGSRIFANAILLLLKN
jgi:threonine dehydratase